MRTLLTVAAIALLAGCGSSTAPGATRYNFAIVAGQNQKATASDAASEQPVKSMLTSDPNGTFASRVMDRVRDFLAPAVAYAQGLTIPGTPVANTLVCGREAKPGEPTVVPLCVYTLADGTAPSAIKAGTKAGTYTMAYSAQVPGQLPLPDSTPFAVLPGAPAGIQLRFNLDSTITTISVGDSIDFHKVIRAVTDKYANYIAPASIFDVTATSFLADTVSNYTPSYAEYDPASSNPLPAPATGWFAPGLKVPGSIYVVLYAGGNVAANVTFKVK